MKSRRRSMLAKRRRRQPVVRQRVRLIHYLRERTRAMEDAYTDQLRVQFWRSSANPPTRMPGLDNLAEWHA